MHTLYVQSKIAVRNGIRKFKIAGVRMATSVMLGKSEAFHISYGGRWELAFKLLKKKIT